VTWIRIEELSAYYTYYVDDGCLPTKNIRHIHSQRVRGYMRGEGARGGVWWPSQNDTKGRRERETIYAKDYDARARQWWLVDRYGVGGVGVSRRGRLRSRKIVGWSWRRVSHVVQYGRCSPDDIDTRARQSPPPPTPPHSPAADTYAATYRNLSNQVRYSLLLSSSIYVRKQYNR